MQIKYWKDGAPGNEANHYAGAIQPIDLIIAQKLSFIEGSIIKYICRYKNKGGILDIKKALWYIALLLRELGTAQDLKDALQIMINVQVESTEPQIPQSDR